MPDLNRSILLKMQRTLEVSVLRHLLTTRPLPRLAPLHLPRRLVHAHCRTRLQLRLRLWPVQLKCVILHLPLRPLPGRNHPIELRLRVERSRKPRIDVGLFDHLEGRGGVDEERTITVVVAVVVCLSTRHPIWCILAVLSAYLHPYPELMKYLRRCTSTSEL